MPPDELRGADDHNAVKAWLGRPDAVDLVGPLPPTVEIVDWAGNGQIPDRMHQVEFYVVPFLPRSDITLDAIAKLSSLRVVQVPVAGYEDVLPLVPAHVTLCNARGVHDASTAEWVVTAIVSMIREFPTFVLEQAAGIQRPRRSDVVAGKKILIVGYGSIGAAVERRLNGFEVDVVRLARRPREGVLGIEALDEVLSAADVVVVLVPATPDTRHLVNARFLARMRDGSLLVNAARGSLVDQDALLVEVASGRIRAALDVGEPDPLPSDHPLVTAPGVFYTPHQAGKTVADIPAAYRFIGEQLCRYVAAQPLLNVIAR